MKYVFALTVALLAVVGLMISEAALLRYVVRCEARRFIRVVGGETFGAQRGG